MKLAHLLMFIAVAVLSGCDRSQEERDSANLPAEGSALIPVFHDRQEARHEWIFVLRGQEIVAQRHAFPGYTEATSYVATSPPSQLVERMRRAASEPGDVSPPLPPHGPWFSRSDVPATAGSAPSTHYFANDNREVVALFSDLRAEVSRSGKTVPELPDWVRANPELRKRFGQFE